MSDYDEPCMCGTPFTCLADEHLVDTARAATILGITERAVRQAVSREKLDYERRDKYGYIFDVTAIHQYAATRRARAVAVSQ